ncbi:hypothetical protein CERSUDRAFT_77478 [Gelatoporia subvermispora B]|uniref:Uncharacterized protein n=1 Tax=Ceriporiopsis subvermispora (strain B) TaxID=914234 RepID=M2QK44_CERS8|nr:hypothetical protein CERSUDRAFT_77478 [Gelatoporia subvermispora B]
MSSIKQLLNLNGALSAGAISTRCARHRSCGLWNLDTVRPIFVSHLVYTYTGTNYDNFMALVTEYWHIIPSSVGRYISCDFLLEEQAKSTHARTLNIPVNMPTLLFNALLATLNARHELRAEMAGDGGIISIPISAIATKPSTVTVGANSGSEERP